jgi:hypothetical protein
MDREITCWHCKVVLQPDPPPRCESCPEFCDDDRCPYEGCKQMNDPFPSLWADAMASLPPVEPLVFYPQPNKEGEHLSCMVCDLGADPSRTPPEWLVTLRSDHSTITRGLHERCRHAHTESRYSKARA